MEQNIHRQAGQDGTLRRGGCFQPTLDIPCSSRPAVEVYREHFMRHRPRNRNHDLWGTA